MAQKRRLEVEPGKRPEEGPERRDKEVPAKFRDMGWRDWALKEYARYWYFLGCVFVDIIFTLEVARVSPPSVAAVTPVVFLAAAVAAEFVLYRWLWRSRRPE